MVKSYSFGFYLIVLCLISICIAHPKGDSLRNLSHSSTSGVIYFTPASYEEYILKHPRPYDLIMLYTLKLNCLFCDKVKEEFSKASESYYEGKAYKPDLPGKKRAVFFGILHYSEDAGAIFKSLKLPAQTVIMHTSPHNIVSNDLNEPYIKYDEENIISYRDRRDNPAAHKILEFVNAKAERKIELKKDPILFTLYFLIFVGILYGGYYVYSNYKFILVSPYLWIVVSLSLFIICIGGIVYNIIHGAPFAKFDKNGNIVEFIHTGQRAQYVGEGLLLSGLFCLIGTLMFLMTCINRIPGYWNHKIVFVCLTFIIAFICKTVASLYRVKAAWYRPEFYPPGNYIKGPLLKDQGVAF